MPLTSKLPDVRLRSVTIPPKHDKLFISGSRKFHITLVYWLSRKNSDRTNNTMKAKTLLCSLMTVGLLVGSATYTAKAADKAKSKLEAKAKITKAEAKKIALAKVPKGKVKEAELEEENGKLIWSFDIATPGTKDITEVHVDAVTGEVVSIEKETPADQKKEKQEDAKKKKGGSDQDDKDEAK